MNRDRQQLSAMSAAAWPKADKPPPADPALLASANRALMEQLDESRRMTLVLLRETANAHQSEPVRLALRVLRRLHNITDDEMREET